MWRWLEKFGWFSPERVQELERIEVENARRRLREVWGDQYDYNMIEIRNFMSVVNSATDGALEECLTRINPKTGKRYGNSLYVATSLLALARRMN